MGERWKKPQVARFGEEAKAKGASPEAKEATAKARPWQPVKPEKEGALESLGKGTSRSRDDELHRNPPRERLITRLVHQKRKSLPEESRLISGTSLAKANRSEESCLCR